MNENKSEKKENEKSRKYHKKHINNEIRIDKLNIHLYNNRKMSHKETSSFHQNKNIKNKTNKKNKKNEENKKNKKNYNNYTDYELNSLSYKDALKIDKRTLCEYYISLIKIQNPIIFSFCPIKDYNTLIIKIDLFILSFSFYYFINALFFDESTIHKIYEDKGIYNLIYFIPHLSYSFIISHFISNVIKYIFLSERNIIKIKRQKTYDDSTLIMEKVSKILIIKYICFYCIGTLFLIFFWYYLSSFGAVLQNTQIYLIKNTAICFSVSFFYPFFINIIPAILRHYSLKDDKSTFIYKVDKYLQLI